MPYSIRTVLCKLTTTVEFEWISFEDGSRWSYSRAVVIYRDCWGEEITKAIDLEYISDIIYEHNVPIAHGET